jgi:hypothetical protein
MDFKATAAKARDTLSVVGDDGLTGHQRNSRAAAETRKANGSDSIAGKKRDALFTKKVGEMTEEEFEKLCFGKAKCFVNGAKTRRKRYQERLRSDA